MEEYYLERNKGNLVVYINREVDHHLAKLIRMEVDHEIDGGKVSNLIFDFSHVNFMDSSGIGMIMGRYRKMKFFGGRVGLANITGGVERIFSMSGLYRLVPKYQDVESAIKSMNS